MSFVWVSRWSKIISKSFGFSFNVTYNSQIWLPHVSNLLGLNVSTTPIMAMGCRQCLPLSVVQLKGKHCRKPHCRNGVVDTFGPYCPMLNMNSSFFIHLLFPPHLRTEILLFGLFWLSCFEIKIKLQNRLSTHDLNFECKRKASFMNQLYTYICTI